MAALASWLDTRAHGGQWLVRIEDVDAPRCLPGMGEFILRQLAAVGLRPDEPPKVQSQHTHAYQRALDALVAQGLAYPCQCSRRDIEAALALLGRERQRHGELVYPGTCRNRSADAHAENSKAEICEVRSAAQTKPPPGKQPAWRLRTDFSLSNRPLASVSQAHLATTIIATGVLKWHDRRLGPQQQDIEKMVGDFPLKRADGCLTYQLAVVVDDAAQGITHVVRGEDLADNTARQTLLQHGLGLPTPIYLHTPLVLGENGEKLSKQNGALALDTSQPLVALDAAARTLGLNPFPSATTPITDALTAWTHQWRNLYALA